MDIDKNTMINFYKYTIYGSETIHRYIDISYHYSQRYTKCIVNA